MSQITLKRVKSVTHLEGDGLPREGFHENLHPADKSAGGEHREKR